MHNARMKHQRNFGSRLMHVAKRRHGPGKLTQAAVAKRIGIAAPTLSEYISDKKHPQMETALNAATAYGCCVEWLLTGRGPMEPWPGDLPQDVQQIVDLLLRLSPADREILLPVVGALCDTRIGAKQPRYVQIRSAVEPNET